MITIAAPPLLPTLLPTMMPALFGAETVSLEVNGLLFEGFVSVEVSRSVKEMAGSFSVKVIEILDGPSMVAAWPIQPGDACVVRYEGEPVITGYVDAVSPRYDARHHEVTIQGRSKTGDLCDCSSEADMPSGEMTKVDLEQLARKLAGPYGIPVVVDADVSETWPVVRVHPGETVHETVERYARPGATALTDTARGELRLLQVREQAPVDTLMEGYNILEGAAVLRADNRFSSYGVNGQDAGSNTESGRPVAQRRAESRDARVRRHRPMRMLNETRTTRGHARSRAAWEASARAGESTRAEIKVRGWRAASGKLWTPGDTVMVWSPMLRLARTLAIETVKLSQGTETIAQLSLVPHEALTPKAGAGAPAAAGGLSDATGTLWIDTKPAILPVLLSPAGPG